MTGAVKPKLLVTRPQPGADQTAARLSALGIEPLVLPFTEMVGIPHQLAGAASNDAVAIIVTSANALRFADEKLLNQLKHLTVYAVGDATKDAALEKNFSKVVSADGDARDLIELVSERLKQNECIIYLCGETRSDDIEIELGKLGFIITVVETYQTNKVSQLTYSLQELIEDHSLDGALLYSSISASIFGELWSQRPTRNLSVIPTIFCISERAKSALPATLQDQAIVCSQPRDDVMTETVVSYFRSENSEL